MPADGSAPALFLTDSFAGIGGASYGMKLATGCEVSLAINHWNVAVAMHSLNHKSTVHHCASVYDVDPKTACGGRQPDAAWFSPDCTQFSRAKGERPKENALRGLPWIVPTWAREVRPRVIFVENVPEFVDWGPLDDNDKPIKARKGEIFREWVADLQRLGYSVEWKKLRAHHYGAPTSRERLFVVARCDGQPIAWPAPTHGPGLKPFRTAAECIDWSIPSLSIFATKAEARQFSRWMKTRTGKRCGVPKRPLADKTLRRIAKGLERFVVNNPRPFIVPVSHGEKGGFRVHDIDDPLRTVTSAHRGDLAVVTPLFTKAHAHGWDRPGWDRPGSAGGDPLHTITATEEHAVIVPVLSKAPLLVQTGYGERPEKPGHPAQAPRCLDIEAPLGVIVGCGQRHGLAELFLERAAAGDAIGAAFVARNFGDRETGGWAGGEVADGPLSTVTARDHHGVVTAFAVNLKGSGPRGGVAVDEPAQGICAQGNHIAEVRAFLVKYYGQGIGQGVDVPLDTVTAKARFGLVTIAGEDYQIVDIGFRMLTPRELARCQGFPEDYALEVDAAGAPLTTEDQVRLVGNSVPPQVAAAVVRANLVDVAIARAA